MSDLVTKRGRPRKLPKPETAPVSTSVENELMDELIDVPKVESEPIPEPEVKPAKKQAKPRAKKGKAVSACIVKSPQAGESDEWIIDLRRPGCEEKMRITVEFQT